MDMATGGSARTAEGGAGARGEETKVEDLEVEGLAEVSKGQVHRLRLLRRVVVSNKSSQYRL